MSTNLFSRELRTMGAQDVIQHATYKYENLSADLVGGSGSSVTINNVAGKRTRFKLPDKVMNLHRSYLKFDSKFNADSGANLKYRLFADCWREIKNLYLKTVNGQVIIINAMNVHKYTKGVFRHYNKITDVMTFDVPDPFNVTVNIMNGTFEGLIPQVGYCKEIPYTPAMTSAPADTTATITTVRAALLGLSFKKNTQLARPALISAHVNEVCFSNNEPIYIQSATDAAADDLGCHSRYRFGMLEDSFFKFDEDVYFGQIMELEIEWNTKDAIAFEGKDNVGGVLAAAAVQGTATGINLDMAVASGDFVLTDIELELCVEQNKDIISDIQNKFASGGLHYKTPFMYHTVLNPNAGENLTLQLEIYPSLGTHLQKIIWIPYNPFENFFGMYYHGSKSHYNGTTGAVVDNTSIVSFQPVFDNIPYYPYYLEFSKNHPYLLKRDKLKGSCIASSDEYNHNFTWIEDFTDNYSVGEKPLNPFAKSVMIDGMPITRQHRYDIKIVGRGGTFQRQHYIYTVVLKNLHITKNGIELEQLP